MLRGAAPGILIESPRTSMAALLFLPLFAVLATAVTHPSDTAALRAFHNQIIDSDNRLSNWQGDDPCGTSNTTQTNWEGVFCIQQANNIFRVTELRLLNHRLSGTLSPELGNLDKLTILDVMWNGITGSIPPSFGRLQSLKLLLLNGNSLTGVLPSELGNLTNMNRIQIDQNFISGPVPTTFGNLVSAQHFHMNNNSLNGSLPPELGRMPKIRHILLDNNQLQGKLPVELSNLTTLRILQLDNNRFDPDAEIPQEYGKLTTLFKLSLRNSGLTGAVPDFSSISQLGYLDLSQNRLNGTIPRGSLSSNITSIDLSNNLLTGDIPSSFGNLPNLQALMLQNNNLSGSVSGTLFGTRNFSLLLDFQNNNFSSVDPDFIGNATSGQNVTVWMSGNPVCSSAQNLSRVCGSGSTTTLTQSDQSRRDQNMASCDARTCNPDTEELIPTLAEMGRCLCASPAVIGYRLKSPGFTFFERYRNRFDGYISSGLLLQLQQVFVKNVTWERGPRLRMFIAIYPNATTDRQNRSLGIPELRRLLQEFATWNIPDDDVFGPYEFISFQPPSGVRLYDIIEPPSSKRLSGGAIAGILVGSIAATAIIVGLAAIFLLRKTNILRSKSTKRLLAERRRLNESLKVTGMRSFTFGEMLNVTDSFSDSHIVGRGGYGKVYRGVIDGDHVVAIKRAEEGSLQGAREFYTEIELLSRIHHRNLVSLVGYCDDEGEQMLIYEFMEGGTLRDRLSPNIKLPLDFATRLRIALGAARGILYLHTEANPPIFHRDIKATNILLDGKTTAKVADFGLSRLAPSPDLDGSAPGHVSTVVKGTPGYLDPEYFLTRQLTDKSDVYSFGVVLLELVTGMHPISQGKNLVREATAAYHSGNILSMVDRRMGTYPSDGIEPLVRLAVSCTKEFTNERPSMSEVVRDLEDLWRSMPWADAFSTMEAASDKSPVAHDDIYVPTNELFVSSSLAESALFSGTVPNVAPR